MIGLDDRHFFGAAAPLRTLYTLVPSPESSESVIAIERVSQREAFVQICKAAFNSSITEMDRLRDQFGLASHLAAVVPVKRLIYPRNFAALPRVCDTILADLKA